MFSEIQRAVKKLFYRACVFKWFTEFLFWLMHCHFMTCKLFLYLVRVDTESLIGTMVFVFMSVSIEIICSLYHHFVAVLTLLILNMWLSRCFFICFQP